MKILHTIWAISFQKYSGCENSIKNNLESKNAVMNCPPFPSTKRNTCFSLGQWQWKWGKPLSSLYILPQDEQVGRVTQSSLCSSTRWLRGQILKLCYSFDETISLSYSILRSLFFFFETYATGDQLISTPTSVLHAL